MKYRRPKEVTQRDWLRRMTQSTTTGRTRSSAPTRRYFRGRARRISSPVMDPHSHAGHTTRFSEDPHSSAAHSDSYVDNAGEAPQAQRGTRANQPAPSNVLVGSRYIVSDESNSEEVASDTTGDGSADTWETVSPSGAHSHDSDYVNDAGTTPQDQADTRANQPAADTVPVGSRYWVTDERQYERSNGTSWEAFSADQTKVPGVVFHGSDSSVARPTGYSYIIWRGTADPANAVDEDVWQPDDLEQQHNHDTISTNLEVQGAVWPTLGDDAFLESDSPSVYPQGYSMFRDAQGSFPAGGNGIVETVNPTGGANFRQYNWNNGGDELWARMSDDGTTWRDWQDTTTGHASPSRTVAASDSLDNNRNSADYTGDGADDSVAIQNGIDDLPVGTK